MDRKQQEEAFQDEISAVVQRFSKEFDLPPMAAIGILEDVKFRILLRLYEIPDFRLQE